MATFSTRVIDGRSFDRTIEEKEAKKGRTTGQEVESREREVERERD